MMATALTSVALVGAVGIAWQWNRATRLAAAEARARREAQVEAETVANVNNLLFTLLESPLPENRGYDVTLREVIDTSLPGLDERFPDRPESKARSDERSAKPTAGWATRTSPNASFARRCGPSVVRRCPMRPKSSKRQIGSNQRSSPANRCKNFQTR